MHIAQGVLFAVAVALILKLTWKRANTGARIGAIVIVLGAVWLGVALVNTPAAGTMASWTAEGAATDIMAVGNLFHAVAVH